MTTRRRGSPPRTSTACAARAFRLNGMAILVRASLPDARLRRPLRHHGHALSRHRRPALLRASRRSRDAIAYLEVMQNPSADLKFERIMNVPKRGLGDPDAADDLPARPRRRHSACSAPRARSRDGGAEARAAQGASRAHGQFRALAFAPPAPCRIPSLPS